MQPNEPHLLLNQTTALTKSIPRLIPAAANKSTAYTDDELVESIEERRYFNKRFGSKSLTNEMKASLKLLALPDTALSKHARSKSEKNRKATRETVTNKPMHSPRVKKRKIKQSIQRSTFETFLEDEEIRKENGLVNDQLESLKQKDQLQEESLIVSAVRRQWSIFFLLIFQICLNLT